MKEFRTAWNTIMIYTNLVYSDPELVATQKQYSDFIGAVMCPPVSSASLSKGLALAHRSPLKVRITVDSSTGDNLLDYQVRETKRAPQTTSLKSEEEVKTIIDSCDVLYRRVVWATENWDILSGTIKGFEEVVVPFMEICLQDEYRSGPVIKERPLMGDVAFIQEGGYKLRFIANPHRVYQAALAPLGRALYRGLRAIPQDCTYDHEKGVHLIQGWLRSGKPAVSMDLSNATDRAPLDLQLEFASVCGVPTRWLQFLRSTCRGDWRASRRKDKRDYGHIRWTVGSPLGLYPTFALFALWHHSVVQAAFAECGYSPMENGDYPYVILGDDLVICDYEVAALVRAWFLSWGMKIADHKSLQSATHAEFAGRIISSSDVVRGFKWKGQVSDDSFVSFVQQFGPKALMFMRPRHKRVLAYIWDLPEPYGLGYNPHGIPLEERLTHLIEVVWARDERVRTFSSRAERANRLVYNSQTMAEVPYELDLDVTTSDQEAESAVRAMLPGLEQLGAAVWPNLHLIALERGAPDEVLSWLETLLSRNSLLEGRDVATTLVILERKIRTVISKSRDWTRSASRLGEPPWVGAKEPRPRELLQKE